MAVSKLDVQAVKDLMAKTPGMTYVDAARQVRGTPAPTTPTTPTATTPVTSPVTPAAPTTPPPVTPPPVQNELTKQDVLQSTKGMTFEERRNVMQNASAANVVDQTPTPTTPAPAPVTPPAPVIPTPEVKPTVTQTPKVEAPVDRATQINQNLTEGFNNNPSLFANYDTFKKAYGYDTKPQQERDQLDAFFQSKIPQDVGTMYASLKTGAGIPEQAKNTKAYTQAKIKYDMFSKYNSMTPEQLYSSMVSNDIGTELANELSQNPNYTQAKAKYDAYLKTKTNNDAAQGIINAANGKRNEISNPLDKLNDAITKFKDENTLASYRDYIAQEDPELVSDVKKLNEKTQLIQELVDERDDMTRSIIKEHPGMSKGAVYALAARRNEFLNDQIRTMTYETNALTADVKYRQEILDKSYEFDQKAYQDALNFAQQTALAQYQSEQQLANQMQMADYNANIGLAIEQAQFEQKLAQQAQLAKDPVTGVQQILNTYAEMGILPQRSQQEIIADIEKQVAQGIPVETALTNLNKAFQSKPEYQQYLDYQKSKMTQQSEFGFSNLGGGVIAVTDPKTGNVTFKNATSTTSTGNPVAITTSSQKGNDLLNTPAGTIIPSRLSQTTNPNNGKECGEYVNDIAGASLFGNLLSDKTRVANEDTGAIGKAIVWQPSNDANFKKYGHVGVIIGQNSDGSWIVKSSNLKGDGAISVDNVPASVALGYKTIKGVNVSQGTSSGISQLGQFLKDNQNRGPGYSEEDVKAFNQKIDRFIANGDEQGMAVAYRNNLMNDKDFKQEFDNTKKFTTALDTVQGLINDYQAAGKSTNALKSMAEKVARSLGLTTDQALAQLQTQMGFTLANYIKSISGTAASDAEVQRLMGNMASIKNVADLNTTILNQVKANADAGLKSMIDTRMYGMPEDLKYKVFSDVYKPQSEITPTPTQTPTQTTVNPKYYNIVTSTR